LRRFFRGYIISIFETKEDTTIIKARMFSRLLLGLGLALIVFAAAQQAQATLGESVDSISSDRKALASIRHAIIVRNSYSVQEIDTGTTVVREYISPSGIIFGIAWNGLTHPDLMPLLGSYTSEYQEAMSHVQRQPGHRYIQVKTDRVVVEKWGHMRKLQGRAYAPALIPPGISINEIK
jgi:hypothetical protein